MNTQKPLSNSYIQKETIIIKEFLFTFTDDLYKKFKDNTISIINNPKINKNQIGNIIFNPDKLTQQELVEITFNAIVESAQDYEDSKCNVSTVLNLIKRKLCNQKYFFEDFKGSFHSDDLYEFFDFYYDSDDFFEIYLLELLENADITKIESSNEPIIIHHEIIIETVLVQDVNGRAHWDNGFYDEVTHYIYFSAFTSKGKDRRIIRLSDLKTQIS